MPGPDPKVEDGELLAVVVTSPDPFVTAVEVAADVEYSRETVRQRLNALVEKGMLERKEVGASAVVFWLTREGRQEASEYLNRY